VVFIPQKVAQRLKDFVREQAIHPDEGIFQIGYAAARVIVREAGNSVCVRLSPHDVRHHVPTYASRSGNPIEIVSKIILRHANPATAQRYLGKVRDTEAMRWVESLYD
jgi:integrase/recombinase XerD